MLKLRVLCRVVTYDPVTQSILLVRNRGQKWWCAPGGGWEYSQETILECAKREVLEECGVLVDITRFLYVQTLRIKEQDSVWLEQFWLAVPVGSTEIPQKHTDRFGAVEEVCWFNRANVQAVMVYPEILKKTFWETVTVINKTEDRYLGHSVL